MGEEFQGGVCGGNWWNSSRDLFRSSPCSMAINGAGSFGWPNQDHSIMDMKSTKSSNDSTGSTSDVWNQDLLHDNVRSDEDYSNIMQEVTGLNPSMNFHNSPQISNNFCDDPSINSFKQVNQSFHLDQQPNFPLNSDSYSLLQTLFETDSQTEQSLLDNQAMNYSIDSNGFLPDFTKSTPMVKPSFTNTTPFWNATAAPLSNVCSSFIPSTQSQFIPSTLNNKKPNPTSFNSKRHNEEARDLASVAKKNSNEPTFKRPRIETPSPLPTFKVRKEKLGDRITALQQLVSPFGKTDTASVLHEAIDYIKFLHDQLSVLSTPYLKNGSPQLQHQQADDKFNGQDLQKPDLRSRGLCLVPISSTFPVAAETTSDFWTPTFGGTFR